MFLYYVESFAPGSNIKYVTWTRRYTIVSSRGTASTLEKVGISVTKVKEVTKFPELVTIRYSIRIAYFIGFACIFKLNTFTICLQLDGHVKTLHPNVHGGILARIDQSHHMQALEKPNIGKLHKRYPDELSRRDPRSCNCNLNILIICCYALIYYMVWVLFIIFVTSCMLHLKSFY